MLRRCLITGAVLALVLTGSRLAPAASITLTGNVENDFPVLPGNAILIDNPLPVPLGSTAMPQSSPEDVDIPDWMKSDGNATGFNFKDIRLSYDRGSDTLFVGVNFFGIAGDADGNGNPNTSDPRTLQRGGFDQARFGGRETIAVGFDVNNDRKPDIIAGIPLDKSKAGPGLMGFTVNRYAETGLELPYGFGTILPDHIGYLAFEPDALHPDFEFTIANFSKIPGYNPTNPSLGVKAYAGSLDAIIIGEDSISYQAVSPQIIIPEPASLLGWTLLGLAGASAYASRRRRLRLP